MSQRLALPRSTRTFRNTLVASLAAAAFAAGSGLAHGVSQSGEQKDMRRVGHTDLQGRAAYHPYFINYPDGRVIAFVGTHSGNSGADAPKPNPLKAGSPIEPNGTMIIDITDPKKPVEIFHIPGACCRSAVPIQSHVPRLRPAGRHSRARST